MSYKKKLLIITGAGQGIGRELALNAPRNFDLILISKTSNCQKVADEIKGKINKNKISFIKLDLEKKIPKKSFLSKIKIKKYQNINLILCAGVVDNKKNSYLNIKDWHKTFNVNFFGNVQLLNIFCKLSSNNTKVKIIVFSGGGAANSFKEFPIYSATKTALVRTVENYSEKFKSKNFSIFAIAPGAVKTKMLAKVLKIAKVGTKTNINEVVKFVNKCLLINTSLFNGKLIHIRDNLKKISKIKNKNYLKLRRFI